VKQFLSSSVSEVEALQMGFQSIKKLLPDSCRCMESGMLSKLVQTLGGEPRSLPSGYLSFVKSEVARLFPKGWDTAYEGYVLSTSPPLSSCCEGGRAAGGSLAAIGIGQDAFLERVLHGRGRLCPYYAGELLVVQSAGKPRALSKFPAESIYLKPLHKTIYGALSKRSWLLRGPPTEEVLREAGFVAGGGKLVSGDYKSATDCLPIEVMEVALSVMLSHAVSVPANVRELAIRACRPILFSEEESLEVRVGQMMGSLLSFPFLCLQNYLAFRWSLSRAGVKRRVPVVINGDDILFQEPFDGFSAQWFSTVSAVGLEVERTKTSVAHDFGSLNSTLLRWNGDFLSPAWSPRFGMLRPAEHPGSLGRSFADFLRGAPNEYRFRAGRVWFDWHLGELRSAAVSLPSLGFRGLLAKRLASLYHLLHFAEAELPRAPFKHGVSFDGDFVSRHDTSTLSAEEHKQSSIEIAAQKWSNGYCRVDRVREAILYCLARSRAKGDRFDYPSDFSAFWATPNEHQFRQRNAVAPPSPSRKVLVKPWLAPFPAVSDCLLAAAIVAQLSSFEWGNLPAYDEIRSPDDLMRLVCCG
jgi:hypothetical protein